MKPQPVDTVLPEIRPEQGLKTKDKIKIRKVMQSFKICIK
jgi:hypothetical protein